MLPRPPQKSTYLPHVTLSNISLPEEPPCEVCVADVSKVTGYSKACVGKVNYNLTGQRRRCGQGYTVVAKLISGLDVGKA